MQYKHYLLSFLIFYLAVYFGGLKVEAIMKEDINTPISFQIEMLSWQEVNEILPNKSKFRIIDMETGLSFWVQRRAGSKHADVQPLTFDDTKIMKKIYGGKWSWKRRAVFVLMGDQMIAASMSGMPHGFGALHNGFRGHFCLHFYKSRTHRKNNEDPGHKLMILKAAGKDDDFINDMNPYELLAILSVIINQDDQKLLRKVLADSSCVNKLSKQLGGYSYFEIEYVKKERENTDHLLFFQIPAKIKYYSTQAGKEKRMVNFILRKDVLKGRWYIDSCSFYRELIK